LTDKFNILRLIPRDSDFLDRRSGFRGEIFFDQSNNTLRLYNGQTQAGIALAKSDLSNVSNVAFLAKASAAGVSGGGGGGSTTVSVGASVPSSPSNGNLWLNTNNGILYVYINDGDSNQWIQPAVPTSSLATVATSGDYDDLINTPTLSTVAISGNYNDLTNIPNLSVYALSSSLTNYATLTYVNNLLPSTSTPTFNFSIAADDSTQRTINSGNLVKFIGAGGITTSSDADGNVTITGSTSTGNVTFSTTTIDTTDSSGITFTPAVFFNSDITVDNDIFVGNNLFSTASIVTPKITSQSASLTLQSSSVILDGLATFYKSTESINTISGASGTVVHNFQNGSLFLHSSIAANFTANFTNVPTTDNRSITVALILDQGGTAYIPNALQIDGAAQTIKWSGGTPPSGTNNYTDIVNFTLIRSGGSWTVLGSLSTYN
jgi:hypothetical protein